MFEEYKKDLLKFYRIMKENHRLSDNLAPLGRERLRTACIEKFQQNNAQKDKELMRTVFGLADTDEDHIRNIKKFELDRFRPLISFLTIEGRNIRDDKLVKLFAWLIDFPPNEEWQELSDQEKQRVFEDAARKKKITKRNGGGKTTGPKSNQSATRLIPNTYIVISCILLFAIGSISFLTWERMAISVRMPEAGEKHMYWDGDHYEPVKEGDQKPGVSIIPLDLKTLQQQRKITLPDTLTNYSIGKVWYKGHGKDHEFFTDSGSYPKDIQRVLKPLTSTILTKYTSNYRYMLTRLVWFLCAAFVISIGGYLVSRMKRKKNVEKEVQTADDYVTNLPEGQFA